MKTEDNTRDMLAEEIATLFTPGVLIPHEWLLSKLGIKNKKKLKFKDYGDEKAFLAAVDRLENQYRTQIQSLHDRLLEAHKGWLLSMPGEGYMIVPYDEHVSRAYKKFLEKLNTSIRKTNRLFEYRPPVSHEQQQKDDDKIARFSWFVQMIPGQDEE